MNYKIPVHLFDFDGTLSNPEQRRHWVRDKPKNWGAFNRGCINDTPNQAVLSLWEMLYHSPAEVFILSGRMENVKELSVQWLLDKCPSIKEARRSDLRSRLYMRRTNDCRPDEIIKAELLEELKLRLDADNGEGNWEIMGIFDDRPKVVRMWQAQGIFTFDVGQGCEEF